MSSRQCLQLLCKQGPEGHLNQIPQDCWPGKEQKPMMQRAIDTLYPCSKTSGLENMK